MIITLPVVYIRYVIVVRMMWYVLHIMVDLSVIGNSMVMISKIFKSGYKFVSGHDTQIGL
jgi:hypothetical protein